MSEKKQPTATTRIDEELRDKLKAVCAHSKEVFGKLIKATEYIDPLIRPSIERDYEHVMEFIRKGKKRVKKES